MNNNLMFVLEMCQMCREVLETEVSASLQHYGNPMWKTLQEKLRVWMSSNQGQLAKLFVPAFDFQNCLSWSGYP